MDVTGRIDTKNPDETNREVRRIYQSLFGSTLFDRVENTLAAVTELFEGKYHGFQKCDTVYHDLEHTLQAYLAMARIFDGLAKQNPAAISEEFTNILRAPMLRTPVNFAFPASRGARDYARLAALLVEGNA